MHRGKAYRCILRSGKVTVRLQRTAHGQSVVAGTYDLVNDKWENENSKAHLPGYVKQEVEKFFNS